jgi:hypothetical protein
MTCCSACDVDFMLERMRGPRGKYRHIERLAPSVVKHGRKTVGMLRGLQSRVLRIAPAALLDQEIMLLFDEILKFAQISELRTHLLFIKVPTYTDSAAGAVQLPPRSLQ